MKFQNINHENEIKLISDENEIKLISDGSTLKSQYVEDILSNLLNDTDIFYFCKIAIFSLLICVVAMIFFEILTFVISGIFW